jgi:Xaa-Pro aminopeptidase
MTDPTVYATRRARLAAHMGRGLAVVQTAPEVARNADTHYPYRHGSHFYYLTGFDEPEAVVVLVADPGATGPDSPRSILFCRE